MRGTCSCAGAAVACLLLLVLTMETGVRAAAQADMTTISDSNANSAPELAQDMHDVHNLGVELEGLELAAKTANESLQYAQGHMEEDKKFLASAINELHAAILHAKEDKHNAAELKNRADSLTHEAKGLWKEETKLKAAMHAKLDEGNSIQKKGMQLAQQAAQYKSRAAMMAGDAVKKLENAGASAASLLEQTSQSDADFVLGDTQGNGIERMKLRTAAKSVAGRALKALKSALALKRQVQKESA